MIKSKGVVRRFWKKKLDKNENVIGVMIGGTGSGKSYSCIRLATDWVLKNKKKSRIWIIFTHNELLKLLLQEEAPDVKKGDVIIYEEMEISADNRKYWSLMNETIRYVSNICRNRNFIFLMNLPVLAHVDKEVRSLIHMSLETVTKHMEERVCECKFKVNSVNYESGKNYFIYPPVYVHSLREWVKCLTVSIPHPPDVLSRCNVNSLSKYEEMKEEFNQRIYSDLYQRSKVMQKESDKKSFDMDGAVSEIIKNRDEYVYKHGGRSIVDKSLIVERYPVGSRKARRLKKRVERELKINMYAPEKESDD